VSVAIDTMILIWGLKSTHVKGARPTTQDVRDLRRRSIILLDQLAASEETVFLPTVALAEFLLGVDPTDHGSVIADLQERFVVRPFDLPAMSWAARLWLMHRELPKAAQIGRVCLKADVMIVATAKAAGVSVFYSHESKVRKLAELAGMTAKDLPTHSENLFADEEARRRAEEPQ
jgi:hypothetical protein